MNLKLLALLLFFCTFIIPAQLSKHENHEKHGRDDKKEKPGEKPKPGERPEERPGMRPGERPGEKPKPGGKSEEKHGERERGHKPGKRRRRVEDILADYDSSDDSDDDDEGKGEWLLDLQQIRGSCTPNPCLNNGECEEKKGRFKCKCPKFFRGRRCEKGRMICKRDTCGHGQCVLTSTPPYYECKCKAPFKPPHCKTIAPCDPNPCLNGGTCVKDGQDFDCVCKKGFSGKFCRVGPEDCYKGNGESYRGVVSETEDGDDCLFWNAHFLLGTQINPFSTSEDPLGLGPHNFCRNPDGETKPWCFTRAGKKLRWDHCDVRKCSTTNDTAPTAPPKPKPTTAKPAPVQPTIKPIPPLPPTKNPNESPVQPGPEPESPASGTPASESPASGSPASEGSASGGPATESPALGSPTPASPASGTPVLGGPASGSPASDSQVQGSPVPAVESQFKICGKPQPKRSMNRIYGGLKTLPGAQPWQASVQFRPKGTTMPYRHICGGTLIKPCWVLTAGHCIDKKNDFQVVLGTLDLGKVESSGQRHEVVETIVHEQYKETHESVYNDIALLKLKAKDGKCAEESQFVKTACLPTEPFPDGFECTISGWGATPESQYGSRQLLDADVLLISQDVCSSHKVYGKAIDNTMFCAGYLEGGVDSCQGDSGGPLTCVRNQTHYVYGIVSWGDSCGAKEKPGVYTRITQFMDWINAKTASAAR